MPPPIQVFLTTIALAPALRQRQEYMLRVLQVKKVPFTSYDLASDEEAKNLWRRKAPLDKQQLPGVLIGGVYPGTFAEFEEAVECETLDTFLRLNETWESLEDDKPPLEVKPIGVAGAFLPLQMNPKHRPTLSPGPSPAKPAVADGSRGKEIDAGEELSEYGLEGVKVSEQDLMDLVSELIGEEDAGDLLGVGKKQDTGDSKSEVKAEEPH